MRFAHYYYLFLKQFFANKIIIVYKKSTYKRQKIVFKFILSEVEPSATKSHLSETDVYSNCDGGQSTLNSLEFIKILS